MTAVAVLFAALLAYAGTWWVINISIPVWRYLRRRGEASKPTVTCDNGSRNGG